MTAQEALQKIKMMFADMPTVADPTQSVPAPEVPTNAPKEYVLIDGSKILIDNYAIGGNVMLVDTSGQSIAAPQGEYILADNTVITVDATSKIVEIGLPDSQEPADPMEPNTMPSTAPTTNPVAAQISKLQTELDSLKGLLATTQSKFEDQQNLIVGLKDVLVGLINTPSTEPTEPSPNNFRHVESKKDKISKYLEFVKTIKNN